MIEFGKKYFYAKENKIVFPVVISDEQIICSDAKGNTVVVLKSSDLSPAVSVPKKTVVPSFIPSVQKTEPVIIKTEQPTTVGAEAPVITTAPEVINVKTPEVKDIEPELVSTIVQPIIVATSEKPEKKKAKVIVTEDEYI